MTKAMTKKEVKTRIEKGIRSAKRDTFYPAVPFLKTIGTSLARKDFTKAAKCLIRNDSFDTELNVHIGTKLMTHIADELKRRDKKTLKKFLAAFYVAGHN